MEIIKAKIGNRVIEIGINQVYCFRSDGAYTRVMYDAGEVLVLDSLSLLEEKYDDKVIRVQRGVLINVDYLESINEGDYSCYAVVQHVNERLPVSKRQLPNIQKKLNKIDPSRTINDARYDWIVSYVNKEGSVDVLNEEFVYGYINEFGQFFEERYAAPKCTQLNKDLSYLYKERVLDRFSVGTPSELILRDYPKWVYRYFNSSARSARSEVDDE